MGDSYAKRMLNADQYDAMYGDDDRAAEQAEQLDEAIAKRIEYIQGLETPTEKAKELLKLLLKYQQVWALG